MLGCMDGSAWEMALLPGQPGTQPPPHPAPRARQLLPGAELRFYGDTLFFRAWVGHRWSVEVGDLCSPVFGT